MFNDNMQYVLCHSGGIDSSVLFHRMIAENTLFRVFHVCHGNRASDILAKEFVSSICAKYNIPYEEGFLPITSETSGRKERLLFYKQNLREGEVLVMGHHKDDSIESILYNFFNGSGFAGLAGIKHLNVIDGMHICRPFIAAGMSKKEIRDYASSNNVEYVDDVMNHDLSIPRNVIRKMIMPMVESFFPDFKKHIYNFSLKCQEQNELNIFAAQYLDGLMSRSDSISLSSTNAVYDTQFSCFKQSDVFLKNWFFCKFKQLGVSLTTRHYDEFIRFLSSPGMEMSLPNFYLIKKIKFTSTPVFVIKTSHSISNSPPLA